MTKRGIIGYRAKEPSLTIEPISYIDPYTIYSSSYDSSKIIPLNYWDYYGEQVDVISEGGFATGFKYLNKSQSGTPAVAIKVPRTFDANTLLIPSQDLIIEAGILIRAKHANIVDIIDIVWNIGEDVIEMGIVIPLAEGDLWSILKKRVLSDSDRNKIVYQILSGVAYLHSRHILHGDIKPGNILFYGVDDVRLSDLGSGKLFLCEPNNLFSNNVYTLWYKPPEVLLSDVAIYDLSADIWATAATIWEIYTGRVLFLQHVRSGHAQLDRIFLILGKPGTTEIWPEAAQMFDLSKYPQYSADLEVVTDPLNSDIARIIVSMLTYDPKMRPDIFSILKEPYFDTFRTLESESNIKNCFVSHETRDRHIISNYEQALGDEFEDTRKYFMRTLADGTLRASYHLKTYLIASYLVDQSVVHVKPKMNEIDLYFVACLSIAADISEFRILLAEEYLKLTHNRYYVWDLNSMRIRILNSVQFDVVCTVPYDYREEFKRIMPGRVWNITKGFFLVASLSRVRLELLPHDIFYLCIELASLYDTNGVIGLRVLGFSAPNITAEPKKMFLGALMSESSFWPANSFFNVLTTTNKSMEDYYKTLSSILRGQK